MTSAINAGRPQLFPEQQMVIQQQIELYESYSEQILHAIDSDDNAAVARVDPRLSDAFNKILSEEPSDVAGKSAQIEYLLDQLLPGHERTKMQQEICDKLQHMLSDTPTKN